ncbi:MAG: hypothetical protein AB7O28_00130 [Vicinamibacterales bacterium]
MFRSTIVLMAVVLTAAAASAQSVGTFTWQTQPYCNVLTLTITQQGSTYALDGSDDLCGSDTHAPVTGLAVPNADGTIQFGLTIVTSGGAPIHLAVPLGVATLGGTWKDSAGNTGTFTFNARKAAFRAGEDKSGNWNDLSTGYGSVAMGVGPNASGDFSVAIGREAIALGEDPLRISTIDADGIALRAIQALEARTRPLVDADDALRARMEALADENRALAAQLTALKAEFAALRARVTPPEASPR